MLDLVTIGDLLIDFTHVGWSEQGGMLFERNPGGAPMNMAAQLQKLGGTAGVITTVGRDEHGEYLHGLMKDMGIDVTNIQFSDTVGTRFWFVYLEEDGDRVFSNYQGTRSDYETRAELLDVRMLENCKVFAYSTLCLEEGKPVKEAGEKALAVAKAHGAMIAVDPNLRFPYADPVRKQRVTDCIWDSQILKLTEEEFDYFLDGASVEEGAAALLVKNAKIIAVTKGAEGSILYTKHAKAEAPSYQVETQDTTGAGDSFMGSLVYQLTRDGVEIDALTEADLYEIAKFCNACAGLSTTKRGSLLVMPTMEEVQTLMRTGVFRK